MINDIKIGDKVLLYKSDSCHLLEFNKVYTVSEIEYKYANNKTQMIALKDIVEFIYDTPIFFDARRFITDVKLIRKLKLEEIIKNNE